MAESNLADDYQGWSDEDAEAEREEIEKGGGGGEFGKLERGVNIIRLLPAKKPRPPKEGSKAPAKEPNTRPYRRIWVHIFKWAGEWQRALCVKKMENRKCAACRKSDELKASRNRRDRIKGKDMFPRRSWVWNAINREEPDSGPKKYEFSKQVAEGLTDLREDCGDPTRVDEGGWDVKIRKKGEGMKTKYIVMQGQKCSLADDPEQIRDWMNAAADLDEYVGSLYKTEEELEEIFEAAADDEDEDEDRPRRRRRNEDEDEDERPARRARTTRDEDEDEPVRPKRKPADDDDDDDPPPRRRRPAEDDD